jgi:surfactin synthase thioesterase subunit
LYQEKVVNMPWDLQALEDTIYDGISELPSDADVVLLLTGFCYGCMLARDALLERELKYKVLVYDSFNGVHHEIEEDVILE